MGIKNFKINQLELSFEKKNTTVVLSLLGDRIVSSVGSVKLVVYAPIYTIKDKNG